MPRAPDERRRHRCAAACDACKRRKEKCSGGKPCSRCTERRVQEICHFTDRTTSIRQSEVRQISADDVRSPEINDTEPQIPAQPLVPLIESSSCRLIQDAKGKHMFIGDSANLSFLQIVRQLVQRKLGPCPFVNDQFRNFMVEASPNLTKNNLIDVLLIPLPDQAAIARLIHWYSVSTNGILDLWDDDLLPTKILHWSHRHEDGSIAKEDPTMDAIYNLVLAIGAQLSPEEDNDVLANRLFQQGHYLTLSRLMEDPSLMAVQAYGLHAMYLLGASRRNAASMYFGIAVQAAHAIGLQQRNVSKLFSSSDCKDRERSWRMLRRLDIFISASLGRPLCTKETRDVSNVQHDYSASLDLCSIIDTILGQVYFERRTDIRMLKNISSHHRQWSNRYRRGLESDNIYSKNLAEPGISSLGLMHLKVNYHWSIILLTRPFLVQRATLDTTAVTKNMNLTDEDPGVINWPKAIAESCILSAISIVKETSILIQDESIPRRLPVIVNAVFAAALVIGVASFSRFDVDFSLFEHLSTAQSVLAIFTGDKISQRFHDIVQLLENACKAWRSKSNQSSLSTSQKMVSTIFGNLNHEESATLSQPCLNHWSPRGDTTGSLEGLLSGNYPASDNRDQDMQSFDIYTPYISNNAASSATQDGMLNTVGLSLDHLSPQTLLFSSADDHGSIFPSFA